MPLFATTYGSTIAALAASTLMVLTALAKRRLELRAPRDRRRTWWPPWQRPQKG
jgi:hypothetical protein